MAVRYESTTLQKRTPVSLRLDAKTVDYIMDYARLNNLSKTDAFTHFLEAGIAVEEESKDGNDLKRVQSLLEGALQIVKNRQ